MSKKDKEIAIREGETTKVVVKKRGGCGSFFLGFLFTFVFILALVVGCGLYLYYNFNINMVERIVGVTIPVEGELKSMSVKELLAKKDQLVNASIATLESEFGVVIPATIPGTEISLAETYEDTITFKGQSVKVKDIRVQDIVNNLDEFIKEVLPKMYSHVTIGQITATAQVTLLEDLGYPALADEFYNVGTATDPEYKKLSELTIEQALELVPAYFAKDTLTVQGALDAVGVELLPYPTEPGAVDVYASLREMKIEDLNAETLTTKITGEVLNKLIDLSAYDFLQTAEFNQTSVHDLGNYMLTLSLGQFVTLDGVLGDEPNKTAFYNKTQFANLDGSTKLSNIKEAISALTIDQIFSASDIAAIEASFVGASSQTVAEFLAGKTGTFASLTGVDCDSYGAYVAVIGGATAENLATKINETSTFDLLGGADEVGPIAGLSDLTLQEITESDNAVNLMLENFGTLGDLVGSTSSGLFGIISGVTIQDLLNTPGTAITDKLKASTSTLGDLLETTAGSNKILNTVIGITVGELFTNGGEAITNSLSTKTLGDLIDLPSEGFVGLLKNVSFGSLMGSDANAAIINALTKKADNSDVTLGEFLQMSGTTGIVAKMAGIKMADLLGDGANPATALQGIVDDLALRDVFGTETPTSGVLKDLYEQTGTGESAGTMKVSKIFDYINGVKLSSVFGASKPAIFNLVTNYGDLTLGNMSDTMTFKASSEMTLGDLIDAGVIADNAYTAEIKATTLDDILAGYIIYKAEHPGA